MAKTVLKGISADQTATIPLEGNGLENAEVVNKLLGQGWQLQSISGDGAVITRSMTIDLDEAPAKAGKEPAAAAGNDAHGGGRSGKGKKGGRGKVCPLCDEKNGPVKPCKRYKRGCGRLACKSCNPNKGLCDGCERKAQVEGDR